MNNGNPTSRPWLMHHCLALHKLHATPGNCYTMVLSGDLHDQIFVRSEPGYELKLRVQEILFETT